MLVGTILGVIIGILLYALAIWVVGKLGLGLKVSGFVPAIIAAVVIAVASALIVWLLGAIGLSLGGFLGAIIHLIIAALVLMFAGNVVKGLKVKGFVPALIAAVAIAVVSWVIDGVVGLLF
jgi:putative membrane protein